MIYVFIRKAIRVPSYMGVQHKSRIRTTLQCVLVKIMYHEFIIASTMLIMERKAIRFGCVAGRLMLNEIARTSVTSFARYHCCDNATGSSLQNWTEWIRESRVSCELNDSRLICIY